MYGGMVGAVCRRDAGFVSRYGDSSHKNDFVEAIATFARIQRTGLKELTRRSAKRPKRDGVSGMISQWFPLEGWSSRAGLNDRYFGACRPDDCRLKLGAVYPSVERACWLEKQIVKFGTCGVSSASPGKREL